jgi:hypothetical protein
MGKARDQWGEASMFPMGLAAVLGVLVLWPMVLLVDKVRLSRSLAN